MNYVMAFLAYCWCITTILHACMGCMVWQFPYTRCTVPFVPWLVLHYRIVCMCTLHGMVVSVHPVYSTVCTIIGVSLPYHMHVLQYTPHNTVWLVPHYRIICMYTFHGTVVFVHPLFSTIRTMLVPWFNIAQFASIVVSHLFVLQTPHWSHPSSNFLFFLLSFSLYTCLLLIPGECSIVVLLLLVMWFSSHCTLINLVTAFLAYCCWCITTVLHACTGSMGQ